MNNNLFFVFDVESIGLYGEAWAVAWVLTAIDGAYLDEGVAVCPQETAKGDNAGREWVKANCPQLPVTHQTPKDIRDVFWQAWENAKAKGATAWVDCGYPVETSFLRACIEDDHARTWEAPFPLHEIATVFELSGLNATAKQQRLGDEPEHNPLGDARQSARLLRLSIQKLNK